MLPKMSSLQVEGGLGSRTGLAGRVSVGLVAEDARAELKTVLDGLADLHDGVGLVRGARDPDGYLVALGAYVDDGAADVLVLRVERLADEHHEYLHPVAVRVGLAGAVDLDEPAAAVAIALVLPGRLDALLENAARKRTNKKGITLRVQTRDVLEVHKNTLFKVQTSDTKTGNFGCILPSDDFKPKTTLNGV
jgi:hypothetical protein